LVLQGIKGQRRKKEVYMKEKGASGGESRRSHKKRHLALTLAKKERGGPLRGERDEESLRKNEWLARTGGPDKT